MATSVDRPWWLEPNRVRVTLTTGALERVDVAAKSMGVRRGRVLDALLRVLHAAPERVATDGFLRSP